MGNIRRIEGKLKKNAETQKRNQRKPQKNTRANFKKKGTDDRGGWQRTQERNRAKAEKIAAEVAERENAKREKEARIQSYKKKRLERTKVIRKKTHRGQPLMKDRMQMLLTQIQEMKRS